MITEREGVFRLDTERTSYWFRVTKFGHLEHIYYGARLREDEDPELFAEKHNVPVGSSVLYDKSDALYCLDNICLEWSGTGAGDFREPPCELKMPDGSFANDFVYKSHAITRGTVSPEELPSAYGGDEECETLTVTLGERSNDAQLTLYYTVFYESDVITRRAALRNNEEQPLTIRRMMSLSVDMPHEGYELVTFDGGWIKETHRHERELQYGIYVNSSLTGASSNKHNPGFALRERGKGEESGAAYGFNLVYSGNHRGAVELNERDLLRITLGINPACFEWTLERGESFETPEAVMTFSADGMGGMSRSFHKFINEHIVRGDFKGKERPVLINSWESNFFDFTRGKLMGLARRAKKLGVELFVLDDGWFKGRDSDNAGLGDYSSNLKKLPAGVTGFAKDIRRLGLQFGLWMEPEMVNENSDLFRAHPDWALAVRGKTPTLGRNQRVLDLCRKEVRDYIVENVSRVLDETEAVYVKWDMNRHISDAYSPALGNQGEFYHRYILGLYDILARIFYTRPHILFESCSRGGNRLDLGMLCYSQQVWISDDTDPIERLAIAGGASCLYSLSAVGAHVSAAPHQQTLRDTPLATRFNVSCFGCLGYELDFGRLNKVELDEVREQIAFYKERRALFQFGRFYRLESHKDNKVIWQCVSEDKSEAAVGVFQTQTTAAEGGDTLKLAGLDPAARYLFTARRQSVFIKRFGGLIKHLLPVDLNPEGVLVRTANKLFCLHEGGESVEASGAALMSGIRLPEQFMGTGYDKSMRVLGDFGSNIYYIKKI